MPFNLTTQLCVHLKGGLFLEKSHVRELSNIVVRATSENLSVNLRVCLAYAICTFAMVRIFVISESDRGSSTSLSLKPKCSLKSFDRNL